ncbi:hypothetical protein V6N13_068574 [Hibiscus sabdariffa]|uniref:Uncharacterized protein n=1 Tax=Hibiscus sabdariffa TaxID=183260 RepID=A0ABR2QN10_9ROSI
MSRKSPEPGTSSLSSRSSSLRKNNDEYVSPNELSPGLLDLHSFDTELRSEIIGFGLNDSSELESDRTKIPSRTVEILASYHALVFVDNKLECLKFLKEMQFGGSQEFFAKPFCHSTAVSNLYLEASSTIIKVLKANTGVIASTQLLLEMERLHVTIMDSTPKLQNGFGSALNIGTLVAAAERRETPIEIRVGSINSSASRHL